MSCEVPVPYVCAPFSLHVYTKEGRSYRVLPGLVEQVGVVHVGHVTAEALGQEGRGQGTEVEVHIGRLLLLLPHLLVLVQRLVAILVFLVFVEKALEGGGVWVAGDVAHQVA
jgi:hypothetical protein